MNPVLLLAAILCAACFGYVQCLSHKTGGRYTEWDGQDSCNNLNKTGPIPDVFWINMDKSKSRRVLMEKQLAAVGLLKESSRIRAMTPNSVIIPESLATPYECKLLEKSQYSQVHELKKRPGNRVLIDALCGRPRNSKKEIVVTASHLQALRTAVNSYSHSDYALILEDDMEFAFDVDFHALAESAPKGFAVLQLITSNDQNLKYLWKKYTSSNGQDLWEQRSDVTDFWCAGAYLINKAVMRPVVNRIVHRATSNGWYAMSLIAAYDCKPSYCCDREGDVINPKTGVRTGEIGNALAVGLDYNNETRYKDKIQSGELNPSCIRAPRGITADHFIFEMARPHAYTMTIPLFRGSSIGANSTVHQEQVQWHEIAFQSILAIQRELGMKKRKPGEGEDENVVKLPSFIKECPGPDSGPAVEDKPRSPVA